MQGLILVTTVVVVLSTNPASAAPTNWRQGRETPLPVLVQFPELPAGTIPPQLDLSNLDEQARAQARSILDEVVSRYPTLIDSFASLLNTQSLLSSPSLLQSLRSPELPALPALPQLPKLTDVLPNVPSLPLPALPSLPGLGGGQSVDPSAPLSAAVDVVLSNLRGFASSPLQLSPLKLTPLGGTPINTPDLFSGTRSLQLPKVMVPLVLTFPNEEGLSPEDLAESIKKKIREQSPPGTGTDDALGALVSLNPLALTHVVDVKPLPPSKEPPPEAMAFPKPIRRVLPGSLFTGGNTEVKIFWDDPDKPADDSPAKLRMDMEEKPFVFRDLSDFERRLRPVTYPRASA